MEKKVIHKKAIENISEPKSEIKNNDYKVFTPFVVKRLHGAEEITKNAKAKGGTSILTYEHYNAKLPIYKAARKKFDVNKAKEEFTQKLTNLSYSMEQDEFQKLMGELEVLGELIIKHENDTKQKMAEGGMMADGGEVSDINATIRKNKNKITKLLIEKYDFGAFDGGCVIVADAISEWIGGDVVVLVRKDGFADHAAVKKGYVLFDLDGGKPLDKFIKNFNEQEIASTTMVRPIKKSDLKNAPRDAELSNKIKEILSAKKMALGGMTPGRYYKDNKGVEYRFVGKSEGKLLFKDGENVISKSQSDFEEFPKENKLFGIFKKGGKTEPKKSKKPKVTNMRKMYGE